MESLMATPTPPIGAGFDAMESPSLARVMPDRAIAPASDMESTCESLITQFAPDAAFGIVVVFVLLRLAGTLLAAFPKKNLSEKFQFCGTRASIPLHIAPDPAFTADGDKGKGPDGTMGACAYDGTIDSAKSKSAAESIRIFDRVAGESNCLTSICQRPS